MQSRLFTSVINSTTIVIIGGFYGQEILSNVVCVDIPTNTWTHYPSFPNEFFQTTLVSTVSFNKNGKRYDKTILNQLGILYM
jgi:hypothetical protein